MLTFRSLRSPSKDRIPLDPFFTRERCSTRCARTQGSRSSSRAGRDLGWSDPMGVAKGWNALLSVSIPSGFESLPPSQIPSFGLRCGVRDRLPSRSPPTAQADPPVAGLRREAEPTWNTS
jgi:hypothetical protein